MRDLFEAPLVRQPFLLVFAAHGRPDRAKPAQRCGQTCTCKLLLASVPDVGHLALPVVVPRPLPLLQLLAGSPGPVGDGRLLAQCPRRPTRPSHIWRQLLLAQTPGAMQAEPGEARGRKVPRLLPRADRRADHRAVADNVLARRSWAPRRGDPHPGDHLVGPRDGVGREAVPGHPVRPEPREQVAAQVHIDVLRRLHLAHGIRAHRLAERRVMQVDLGR
mmetsp:Transcript_84980/g.259507  ORF Transcript_84980/g.259507 Transcript_84980/m.259507 type:complete len:219 (+) Transcript_84980:365-1021(+)